MANDTTLTPEQLELLRQYNALSQEVRSSWQSIANQVSAANAAVEESLGNQTAYASENDRLLALSNDMITAQQEQLALEQERIRLLAEQAELKKKKKKLTTDQKARLKEIEEITGKTTEMNADQLNDLKKQLNLLKQQNTELRKKEAAETNAEKIATNQLTKMTGMTHEAGTMGELLVKSLVEGEGLEAAMTGVSKAFGKTFTAANMAMTVLGKMVEMGKEFEKNILSADGALMNLAETDIRFVRETGGLKQFGEQLEGLKVDFLDLNYTFKETEDAYIGLFQSSKLFSTQIEGISSLTDAQRTSMTRHAATLARFGVATDTLAESYDALSKTFGDTPAEMNKMTEQMVKFGRAMGVGPNKMLQDFNKAMPIMAKYGRQEGTRVFKELATTAQLTGVAIDDLINITKGFDTFESAAESAGKLNFILGGPMLNSVDLLNMNEADLIKTLRESVKASGRAFDEMGRREKELIAKQLGTSVDIAQRIFNDENLGSIEDATAAIEQQAQAQGDLGEEAKANTTLAEKQQLAAEAQIAAMESLGTWIQDIQNWWADLMITLAPFKAVLSGIAWAFGALFKAFLFLKGIPLMIAGIKAIFLAIGGAITGVVTAVGAIPLAIAAAVAAAGYLIYKYWDEIKQWFSDGIDWIVGLWDGLWEKVTSIGTWIKEKWQWLSNIIPQMWGYAIDFMKDNIREMVEYFPRKLTWLLGKISSFATKVGDFFKNIVTGIKNFFKSGINWVIRKVNSLSFDVPDWVPGIGGQTWGFDIPELAEGATNFQGGPAIVGENGPELVTLPAGSNVVTNENIEKLMGLSASAFEKLFADSGAQTARAPGAGQAKEQVINITLELEGEVLARTTRRIAMETMTDAFSFSSRGW